MAKKKIKQTEINNGKTHIKVNPKGKSKTNLLQNLPQKQLRSAKLSSIEMKNNNVSIKKKDELYQSEEQPQKSEYEIPTKTKKKISKKSKGKSSKNNERSNKSGIKLQRGYKFCQNCQTVLNIHKYVCTKCGFVHNMKKHKFDVMKNLAKATPKIVKSIIQSNEFNTINLNTQQIFAYESSFDFKSLLIDKREGQIVMEEKSLKNIKHDEIKRRKSQGKHDIVSSIQTQTIHEQQSYKMNKIVFEKLKIMKSSQFSSLVQEQEQKLKITHNQFNKTREDSSIYKSKYPIVCMEVMSMLVNDETKFDKNSNRTLIFTESVSKRQFFPQKNHSNGALGLNQHQRINLNQNQDMNMVDQEIMDKKSLLKKQQLGQQKLKEEQEKAKQSKLRQNNALTEKALSLGNYHKIGALYTGETILNVMPLERRNSTKSKQDSSIKQQSIPDQPFKRRSSSRSAKPGKQKLLIELTENEENKKISPQIKDKISDDDTVYDVLRIGLKEHVQMLKAVRNKVAILSGKKKILLMNLELDWVSIFKSNMNFMRIQSEEKEQKKDDPMFWLQHSDFNRQNNDFLTQNTNDSIPKRYLSLINLSKEEPNSQDDQFTVIQWLKIHNTVDNNNNAESYLITGTLFGHIIIYKVSNENHYETYRTIIGAHFQLVNCLSECPLNINGTALFASASYDGSVKIWQLNHTQPVSQFEVSNRKIQSIHWDSGAKFLLIVRDQGLQNCYLACFYSVNNRIELPMMLTDTIDFRLIRNGLMFDNSCSPLITFPLNSKLIVMLNSRNGFLKILETEELRKTSLKRKKSKKNYQQLLYHDYWMRLGTNYQNSNQTQNLQVIEMKSNCMDYANYGFAMKAFQQIQEDHQLQEEKQENYVINEDSEQSQSKQKSQKLQEQKQIKHKNVMKPAAKKLSQSSQPQGIRKSLRVRKPNIQYNFIEEEEEKESEQQSIRNKKINNKGKKRQSSDGDFEDQSEDFSQQIENDESDESFQNHKKQKNKQNSTKLSFDIKNKKTINKQKQKQKNSHQKGSQLRKSLRSRNDQKKQEENKNQLGQETLYKMFWQQTNEQSLVNKKEEYPCNRFPKFSAITSFLTVQAEIKGGLEQQVHGLDDEAKIPKNQPQNSNEYQQKPLQKFEHFLTSFISTHNGQLIRIRIKIDGDNNHQIGSTKQIDGEEQELSL